MSSVAWYKKYSCFSLGDKKEKGSDFTSRNELWSQNSDAGASTDS